MIALDAYRRYWEAFARHVPGISEVMPVTIDKQMGRKIQALPRGSVTLFVLPPVAESTGGADAFGEKNLCVLFLMAKYDPQRSSAFEVLERTQPLVEELKRRLLTDLSAGCSPLRINGNGITTAPETELYGDFAGWSVEFSILSSGHA